VIIAGEIEVTVIATHGSRVRLGIKAPEWVRVDRQEVHDRKCEFQESKYAVEEPLNA
jgi:carbon storage regulator CsrA